MIKSVIKEFIILLLLLITVAILLAIVFYDYNPLNKTIPKKIDTYTLPEEVETELSNSLNLQEDRIVKTYQIDGTDLNKYKKENEYNPGKIKPYSLDNTSNGVFFDNPGK